jgi:hypothetical protein
MAVNIEPEDVASHVDAYRTAKAMLECARSWEAEARLMGNVRAADIAEACRYLMRIVEAADPMVIFDGVPIRFWVCPDGCRGGVYWSAAGVATCQVCGQCSVSAD